MAQISLLVRLETERIARLKDDANLLPSEKRLLIEMSIGRLGTWREEVGMIGREAEAWGRLQ